MWLANEAVEKVSEGLHYPNYGGALDYPLPANRPADVDFLGASSRNYRNGFFYCFSV